MFGIFRINSRNQLRNWEIVARMRAGDLPRYTETLAHVRFLDGTLVRSTTMWSLRAGRMVNPPAGIGQPWTLTRHGRLTFDKFN